MAVQPRDSAHDAWRDAVDRKRTEKPVRQHARRPCPRTKHGDRTCTAKCLSHRTALGRFEDGITCMTRLTQTSDLRLVLTAVGIQPRRKCPRAPFCTV